MIKILKKHALFLLLIVLVVISQYYLLKPHLQMGFNDLDDGYTMDFKFIRREHPNVLDFVLTTYKRWGAVYFHQYYYPGILNAFFGDNKVAYHQATHIFRILAILSTYVFFFVVTQSTLISFLSALFFGFSYAAIGSFDSVAQSSDYPALIILSLFMAVYFYLLKKGPQTKLILVSIPLLWISLIFSTERTYPVVMLVALIEIALIFLKRTKDSLNQALKRAGPLLLPIIFLVLLQPKIIMIMLLPSWRELGHKLSTGQPELSLVPFVSFASMYFPGAFWTYKDSTLPIGVALFILLASVFFIAKKKLRFLIISLTVYFAGYFLISILSDKAAYFVNFAKIARGGFFLLGLCLAFLDNWRLDKKDYLSKNLFLGLFGSFIFIFSIWLGTGERSSVFTDTHRYFSSAAIFVSLFVGTFFVSLHKRIRYLPFLLLVPLIFMNVLEINKYFNHKLEQGIAFKTQDQMRAQVLPYYQNLDHKHKRLFYMDIDSDRVNGAIYGNSLYAGYNAWPLWWPHLKDFNMDEMPLIERQLKNIKLVQKDGGVWVYCAEQYFRLEDFYAFKWTNLKMEDITKETKQQLKIQ